MAAKKKTKKNQTKSKRTAGKKVMPTKKLAKKPTKTLARKKQPAKKKPAQRKAAVKTTAVGKSTIGVKRARAPKRPVRGKSQSADTVPFPLKRPRASSGGQAGDLQGLSGLEGADSESVDELLEEGNAFEADVVTGVEEAGTADGKEVRTHEVPEDDVPGEYLERD
jgi:hypothetical protein